MIVPTDVSHYAAVINLANSAKDWKDNLHVWVNNACVLAAGPFDETPMVEAQRRMHFIHTRLKSPFI